MVARLTPEQRRWRSFSERQFQSWVTDLATAYGWRWWHHNDSRKQVRPGVFVGDKDAAGFPDLTLCHPTFGVLFAELKREGEVPTPKQVECHEALRAARADVRVWWPHDEAAIMSVLSSVRSHP
jgi:hypothetical protein